jgi:hypothetical protein
MRVYPFWRIRLRQAVFSWWKSMRFGFEKRTPAAV